MNKEYQARSHGGNSGTVPFPPKLRRTQNAWKTNFSRSHPTKCHLPPNLKISHGPRYIVATRRVAQV